MTGAVDIINSTLGKVGSNAENIYYSFKKSKRKSKLKRVDGATSIILVK